MSAPADTGDGVKQPVAQPDAKPEDSKTAATQDAEEFPDPDEDDLDDLDDMLDEFSSVKIGQQEDAAGAQKAEPASKAAPQQPPPAASSQEPAAAAGEPISSDEFAKQLEAGMADLLGELEQSPDMQKQFEELFKSMGGAAKSESSTQNPGDAAKGAPEGSKSAAGEPNLDSFQDTIRRTMERMQASGDSATAAASSSTEEDFMSELLKQMSSGELGGEGGEEEFSKMLMGMMEQLTNKEILYEPMKELHVKFPEWLEKNRDDTPEEDLKRYEVQQAIVADIVGKFEESTYSDDNAKDREYIVDKMQKMQGAGSPPPDLVGDMASAQEAFTGPDEQCNPQ